MVSRLWRGPSKEADTDGDGLIDREEFKKAGIMAHARATAGAGVRALGVYTGSTTNMTWLNAG